MIRKTVWLASASLVALPTAAFAQDTSQVPPAQQQSSPTEQAAVEPAAQAATEAAQEGEIVITAQGRRQILQDVPIAVTAVGAEQMQNSGASDIRQLNQLAPSLLVSSTGTEANGSARIRGIGTVGDNPGLESSVAVFIDGVYRSRSGIGLNELGELDRIEVLRGPQGTLFGRNASAGIINIFSKAPSFAPEIYGEATIMNYSGRRLAGGMTGGITDTLAGRIDMVWVNRDGFYDDPANNTTINNRRRFFTRGQLLFEPNSDLSIRIIGDYTTRDERCCGAVYVDDSVNDDIGNLNEVANPLTQPGTGGPGQPPLRTNDSGNNIVNVLRDLGQDLGALHSGFDRTLSVTPGRDYSGETRDGGLSGQVDYDLGWGSLTSITAYRHYRSEQAGDLDFSTVDIVFRDPGEAARRFNTFSQELRLQGKAFGDRLDWLVGAYYAHEDLKVTDNLRFGNQYGRFATCRIVSPGALSPFYSPTGGACLNATARGLLANPLAPPFGAAGPRVLAAMDNLDAINDRGSTLDVYNQTSKNWALFTHNIFHVTPQIDATVGLRYTHEGKDFDATFGNDNTACPANQALVGVFTNPASPLFTSTTLFNVAEAILRLSCQGNSTSELDGVSIEDDRSEGKLTGTGVLSWKPNKDLMFYASYSHGYKAGGFNLDRSALKNPSAGTFASFGGGNSQAGAQNLVGNLQFDPETVDAFELGGKFGRHGLLLNFAVFRQYFYNFQLNTFDGLVFIVQNINGCKNDLSGADRDQSVNPGADNFIPPVAAPGAAFNINPAALTGQCDDVGWGVRSTGVELEAAYSPMPDLHLNAGMTYANTRYRNNLVGTDEGAPLNPALRELPGSRVSNAPPFVATGAVAWTPRIGSAGLSGLVYFDARYSGHYNTGSDLFPQKLQEAYTVVNGRIGIRGPEERWSVELWAQNLFNKDYAQVAFNSPFQQGGSTTPPFAPGFTFAPFTDPDYPGGRQLFSMFLAEPRTFGLTLRGRLGFARPEMPAVAPPPPPPPPPPPATQTCADGTVILATDTCPPPPPPPPPSGGERGQ